MKKQESVKWCPTIYRKSRGFTLIELLISLALIGIIITAAISMQLFGVKTFKRGEDKSDNQFDVRMAAELITKESRYAKTLELLGSVPSPSPGYNDIYLSGGKIKYYKNGVLTNNTAVNDVNDFTLAFSRISDNMLGFKIGKQGSTDYDVDTRVSILNISNESPYKIKDSSSGAGIGIRFIQGELSDAQAVQVDMDWLQISDPNNITASIYLPTQGPNRTSISWASSNTTFITASGTVTRPTGSDASVVLTATVTRGTVTSQKTFNLTVKMLDSTLTIVKINNISETVNQNATYTLPATVEAQMSDGSVQNRAVTWNPATLSTSTGGTFTGSGTVMGYSQAVTLTLTVKTVAPPIGQVSSSSTSTQLIINFDKTISGVTVITNNTGVAATPSISGTSVTINFSSNFPNNKSVTIKFTSSDGGSNTYTYVYKNGSGWK